MDKCGPKGCSIKAKRSFDRKADQNRARRRKSPAQRSEPKRVEQGWPCPLCSEVFDSLRELKAHEREKLRTESSVWPCHLCSEVFDSLRELNAHNFDQGSNKPKRCANPTPVPHWYDVRFVELLAEIADLKARIRHANKHVGHLNPTDVDGALDLRRKRWGKA